MKLREWMEEPFAVGREQVIGREIKMKDSRALLLGLRETEVPDEDGEGTEVWLDVLVQDSMPKEEAWDEEEEDENQTNRQCLIESMDTDGEVALVDIDAFVVNGRSFETMEMDMQYLEEEEYEAFCRIRRYMQEDAVPDSWSRMETDELAFVCYAVDPGMFEIDWGADILHVAAESEKPTVDVLVGKVMKCRPGRYETPETFSIKGRDGALIGVKLHGMKLVDIWEEGTDEEIVEEMESLCGKDERLLVLEYEVDAPVQLEFYTKEFLDEPVELEDACCGGWMFFGDEKGRQYCVLDAVPKGFDETVEVELLSYSM